MLRWDMAHSNRSASVARRKSAARVLGVLALVGGLGLIAIPLFFVDTHVLKQNDLGLGALMGLYMVGGFLVLLVCGMIALLMFRSARKAERRGRNQDDPPP